MRIRTNVWIEDADGKVVHGLGRQRILEAIDETGSLKAAAAKLGFSYRGLWARLRHSERRIGFALVESHPGRGDHGGTKLTARAEDLLRRYASVLREVYRVSDETYARHMGGVFEDDAAED